MTDLSQYPEELHELLEIIRESPITDRNEILLDYSDRFEGVPEHIATRPYPESHRVVECESDVFVFTERGDNDVVNFYIAVENPQGVSSRALSAILSENLNGVPLAKIESIPETLVFELFGRNVSMGKGAGMMGIIKLLKYFARQSQSQ